MSHSSAHSIKRAQSSIERFIVEKMLRSGDELPPLKQLAALAEVSYVTMWKAATKLKEDGLLDGSSGHPFRVKVTSSENAEDEKSLTKRVPRAPFQITAWRRTAHRMRLDILNGVYATGSQLPSLKELQKRFAVSCSPVKKALESLCDAGLLLPRKRGFAVPAFPSSKVRSRIVLLTHTFDDFTMYLSQHDEEIFKTFERHCHHANITLDVFLLYWGGLDSPKKSRHLMRERRTGHVYELSHLDKIDDPIVLGFVLVVPGLFGELEENLLRIFFKVNKPVAIIDELGTNTLPGIYARSRRIQTFPVAGSVRSAQAVGRYILTLGHRSIAFVSPYHQFSWSRSRLEGLFSLCQPTSDLFTVRSFVAENDPMSGQAPSKFVDFYRSFRTTIDPAQQVEYDSLMTNVHEKTARQAQTRGSVHTMMDRMLMEIQSGLITAIVAVNDQVAGMILGYLKTQGIAVPAQVSVISFDDSASALSLNLTSYNFNASAAATAMMGYILGVRPFTRENPGHRDEIEGYIVERQTSARLSRD